MKTLTKEQIIEKLHKKLLNIDLYKNVIFRSKTQEGIYRFIPNNETLNLAIILASELTERESEVRTAEEILMGILESFDMYLRKAYGEIRFNYDDAAGFVKKLYISDEFASQSQQPEIIAKSGRKYRSIPDDIDIDEWDGMTINERLRYKGLIQQPITDEMTAKIFLQTKGIFSLDTKKRTKEVYEWMEEYASKRIKWALSLKAQPSDELNDIIECVCKFDDKESIENKARYFDVIQRDLRNLIPSKK